MERDSKKRKMAPMYRGVKAYFPAALEAVARLSWAGNEKHQPGLPMHHCRAKSGDHADCIERHQAEYDQLDPDTGELHAVAVAWRALAQLQELLEKNGAPRAPGSFSDQCPACSVTARTDRVEEMAKNGWLTPQQARTLMVVSPGDHMKSREDWAGLPRTFKAESVHDKGVNLRLVWHNGRAYSPSTPVFWTWDQVRNQLEHCDAPQT